MGGGYPCKTKILASEEGFPPGLWQGRKELNSMCALILLIISMHMHTPSNAICIFENLARSLAANAHFPPRRVWPDNLTWYKADSYVLPYKKRRRKTISFHKLFLFLPFQTLAESLISRWINSTWPNIYFVIHMKPWNQGWGRWSFTYGLPSVNVIRKHDCSSESLLRFTLLRFLFSSKHITLVMNLVHATSCMRAKHDIKEQAIELILPCQWL